MKKKLFRTCIYFSTILFLGFIGLYVYVLIFNPNADDRSSISIGHGKISIVHPATSDLSKYLEDGGVNFHISVAKDVSSDMSGCRLIFFNQKVPFWGVRIFAFADDDKIIGKSGFMGYGMEFGSIIHSQKMTGCSDSDQTSEVEFIGYGIFFYDISHSVDKDKTWWTLMISLWYPIILFGILPAIFVARKFRNRKLSSKTAVEKHVQ